MQANRKTREDYQCSRLWREGFSECSSKEPGEARFPKGAFTAWGNGWSESLASKYELDW